MSFAKDAMKYRRKQTKTMIEKGTTDQIIEQLIDSVENGQNVPFAAGKVSVNKEETIRLLRELENIVQGELKIYREVNDRKGKIITEAKKEAEEILEKYDIDKLEKILNNKMGKIKCLING